MIYQADDWEAHQYDHLPTVVKQTKLSVPLASDIHRKGKEVGDSIRFLMHLVEPMTCVTVSIRFVPSDIGEKNV